MSPSNMLVTTTSTLQDRKVSAYLGLVTGESILGANIFRDVFAGIRDIVGGRSGAYEKVLRDAREMAVEEMVERARKLGANGVIGVDVDYETVGGGTMLMVSVSGTAVKVEVALYLVAFLSQQDRQQIARPETTTQPGHGPVYRLHRVRGGALPVRILHPQQKCAVVVTGK